MFLKFLVDTKVISDVADKLKEPLWLHSGQGKTMEYRILSRMNKQPCKFLDHNEFIAAVREDLATERRRFGTSFVAVSVSYRGHVRTGHLRNEEEFLEWICDSIEDLMDQPFSTARSLSREIAPA